MYLKNDLKYKLQKLKFSDLLIIFDIDGVLLRPNLINNREYIYSPIISQLFNFIKIKKIKVAIATHGGNHVTLASEFSPISEHIKKIDKNYIKFIDQPQYKFDNNKYDMNLDLINQGIADYDIKKVIFFDDNINNINTFEKLRIIFPKLKLKSVYIKFNNTDKNETQIYPLLRYESFNSSTNNFNEIIAKLIQ